MVAQSDSARDEPPDGRIVTFYSYKGGTGRTMAAINVAYLLARGEPSGGAPRSVLVIDWDLEAPGVPKYVPGVRRDHPGLIDFFIALRARFADGAQGAERYAAIAAAARYADNDEMSRREALIRAIDAAEPIKNYLQYDVGDPRSAGGISVLSSGMDCEEYASRVTTFDWPGFFQRYPAVFAALRERLAQEFDYTIVDSRTGVTDASGICSVLLPERLVCVFTPNRQSLEGGLGMVRRALVHRRTASLDPRPLVVYPLPSRVEMSETVLREEWRAEYQRSFEELFKELYDEGDDCVMSKYFDEMKVHHRSDYAYGEKIAVLSERDEEISLARVFRKFAGWLESGEVPWGAIPNTPNTSTPATDAAARPLPSGQRPLAASVRAWLADPKRLLTGNALQVALTWASEQGFVYPSEIELIARSVAAERTAHAWVRRGAVIGAIALLGVYAATLIVGLHAKHQQEYELARVSSDLIESDMQLKQARRTFEGQRIALQRQSDDVTLWLDAISRAELLLDDMDDLAFDRAVGLDLREAFESASARLDELAAEIPEISKLLSDLIAKQSDADAAKVPLTSKASFDPLPALQHAADRMQQAQDDLGPLREQRDALQQMLAKAGQSTEVSGARLEARQAWNRGYKQFLDGKYDQARASFEAALKTDPTYAAAYNSLGRLAMMRGDLLNARSYLENALANDPKYVVALSNLATLYVKQAERSTDPVRTSQLKLARRYVNEALELDPAHGPAKRTRARIAALEDPASVAP